MKQPSASLHEVVITHELLHRSARPRHPDVDAPALAAFAAAAADDPDAILHALCRLARQLCAAGSSGVNRFDGDGPERHFRWIVIEGELARYQNSVAPPDHSPCGYVFQRQSAQLFRDCARYFTWLDGVEPAPCEALIVPLQRRRGEFFGTIWVVAHDPGKHFDMEDLRVLSTLADHAAAALTLHIEHYGQR